MGTARPMGTGDEHGLARISPKGTPDHSYVSAVLYMVGRCGCSTTVSTVQDNCTPV